MYIYRTFNLLLDPDSEANTDGMVDTHTRLLANLLPLGIGFRFVSPIHVVCGYGIAIKVEIGIDVLPTDTIAEVLYKGVDITQLLSQHYTLLTSLLSTKTEF
jgi:hypothetical protein